MVISSSWRGGWRRMRGWRGVDGDAPPIGKQSPGQRPGLFITTGAGNRSRTCDLRITNANDCNISHLQTMTCCTEGKLLGKSTLYSRIERMARPKKLHARRASTTAARRSK